MVQTITPSPFLLTQWEYISPRARLIQLCSIAGSSLTQFRGVFEHFPPTQIHLQIYPHIHTNIPRLNTIKFFRRIHAHYMIKTCSLEIRPDPRIPETLIEERASRYAVSFNYRSKKKSTVKINVREHSTGWKYCTVRLN